MIPIDYNNPNDMWRNNGYDPYKGMSDNERMMAGCLQLASMFFFILIAFLVCLLFGSCTTERLVTVEKIRTDTAYITKHQRDSIYIEQHDSIVLHTIGDTVTVERWHWRDRWRDRILIDTIYKSKTDTVYIEKKNEKVETMTVWQLLWKRKWRLVIILVIMAVALWIWKTK